MFLVHFVGDMHQPLHCSDNNDQGGNKVLVKFGDRGGSRPYNLHSLWDSGLLGKMPKEDVLFAEYSRESARHAKKWAKGTVEDWADRTHKIAQKIDLREAAQSGGRRRPSRSTRPMRRRPTR